MNYGPNQIQQGLNAKLYNETEALPLPEKRMRKRR